MEEFSNVQSFPGETKQFYEVVSSPTFKTIRLGLDDHHLVGGFSENPFTDQKSLSEMLLL